MTVRVVPANAPKRIAAEFSRLVEKICVSLVTNVTVELEDSTPKDTGWAAANWLPAVGSPQSAVAAPTTRAERAASVGQAISAQQQQLAAIRSFKLSVGRLFITNSTPYLDELNAGSSRKAPAGFVQGSISRGVNITQAQYP